MGYQEQLAELQLAKDHVIAAAAPTWAGNEIYLSRLNAYERLSFDDEPLGMHNRGGICVMSKNDSAQTREGSVAS